MVTFSVLLVADDPLARSGLASMLENDQFCEIIAQCHSLDLFDGFWPDEPVDIVVWDTGWGYGDELTMPDRLDNAAPIIALLPNDEYAATLWTLGVQGILPRQLKTETLRVAIQAISHNLRVIDPLFTDSLTETAVIDGPTLDDDLTPREFDVLQQLARGLTNKAIAQQLSISDHTVKFHVNAIMTKLHAQSRTDAVVRATQAGLISL